MKPWLMRTAVILSALALLLTGGWWAWRTWWAKDMLQTAITANDADRVDLLVRLGVPVETDVEYAMLQGSSSSLKSNGKPLHWAASRGHKDTVRLLLARGAKVDAKDETGWTALHWAAGQGQKDEKTVIATDDSRDA
jgi:ankyrin repeat protein